MNTIATIGAGNIGSNVAKAAIQAGYSAVLSNSRGPETLTDLVAELGSNARAATTEEAARSGDLVLIAIPLITVFDLRPDLFDGAIVLDANNYYPQRDGRIADLDSNESTTSELVQRHLSGSHVVKVFNHINAADIPTDGLPAGSPGRRALIIAGDDADAKAAVTRFLDTLGFDAVDLGPLSESWRIERDTPGYGARLTAEQLREVTANTERVQQV